MLQDIVSEVFVSQQAAYQQKEGSPVALDQDFESALVAEVRLLDQDVIRQGRRLLLERELCLHTIHPYPCCSLSLRYRGCLMVAIRVPNRLTSPHQCSRDRAAAMRVRDYRSFWSSRSLRGCLDKVNISSSE